MPRINRSTDCGNSPKNKLAEDIAVALETRDIEFLAAVLDSEATWNYESGSRTTAAAILDHVGTLNKQTRVTINHVVSHGKTGAVNGEARQGKDLQRFCHVMEFTSVQCNKLCRIESYGS